MRKFFRNCEKLRMVIEYTVKETQFHNGIKEIHGRIVYMNKISALDA